MNWPLFLGLFCPWQPLGFNSCKGIRKNESESKAVGLTEIFTLRWEGASRFVSRVPGSELSEVKSVAMSGTLCWFSSKLTAASHHFGK